MVNPAPIARRREVFKKSKRNMIYVKIDVMCNVGTAHEKSEKEERQSKGKQVGVATSSRQAFSRRENRSAEAA